MKRLAQLWPVLVGSNPSARVLSTCQYLLKISEAEKDRCLSQQLVTAIGKGDGPKPEKPVYRVINAGCMGRMILNCKRRKAIQ